MATLSDPTLFRLLVQEQGWSTWAVFDMRVRAAARRLADESRRPTLAELSVPRRTFDRWMSGEWRGVPWSPAVEVVEFMLGHTRTELFQAAPGHLMVRASARSGRSSPAVDVITRRWPSSGLLLSPGLPTRGIWEFPGREFFDGTTSAVCFYDAVEESDGRVTVLADPRELEDFLRPARRGLLATTQTQPDGEARINVVDSALLRGSLRGPSECLRLPAAVELDDLTFALLWATLNGDDALLADDGTLVSEEQLQDTYLTLNRSSVSRAQVPGLTSVGAGWLGSGMSARHLLRRLDNTAGVPVFWGREQSGEEFATWLLWRHKQEYLNCLSARHPGPGQLQHAFCVPEASLVGQPPYERLLILLALAAMERRGIHCLVVTDPAYGDVDGFALVPGELAVVASWVRTQEMWSVDTLTHRPVLTRYAECIAYARRHNVIAGPTPAARLRELASYLDLDWVELLGRCARLAETGFSSVTQARSRLMRLDEVDDVLRFLADLARAP